MFSNKYFEIKTYLSEQKVNTLDNATWLADDYSLTHKVTFVSKPHSQQYAADKQLFQSYGNVRFLTGFGRQDPNSYIYDDGGW